MVEGLTSFNAQLKALKEWPRISIDVARQKGKSLRNAGAPSARLITSSLHKDPGDSSGEATPVPIPNTEVKLSSAEDTQGAAPRENRSSPGSFFGSSDLTA